MRSAKMLRDSHMFRHSYSPIVGHVVCPGIFIVSSTCPLKAYYHFKLVVCVLSYDGSIPLLRRKGMAMDRSERRSALVFGIVLSLADNASLRNLNVDGAITISVELCV